MKLSSQLIILVILVLQSVLSFGQNNTILIPGFNDKYSKYVKQLEEGKTDIDYVNFRNSFLDSKQFNLKGSAYDSLKKLVYDDIEKKNYQGVISLTKAMLSIDYTSLFAHKYLQQTYKILGDTINRKKYHDIEFGLLLSITKSGDGKTCETGWHVIQIEEEYFILNIFGAELQIQSLISSGKNMCDRMDVKTDKGESLTYYFEINKVLEMENKLFKK
jgi:hypothetical protein